MQWTLLQGDIDIVIIDYSECYPTIILLIRFPSKDYFLKLKPKHTKPLSDHSTANCTVCSALKENLMNLVKTAQKFCQCGSRDCVNFWCICDEDEDCTCGECQCDECAQCKVCTCLVVVEVTYCLLLSDISKVRQIEFWDKL